MISELFTGYTILEDYTEAGRINLYSSNSHTGLTYFGSKRRMRMDVFIKELRVAFEYQGFFHYHDAPHLFPPLPQRLVRDEEKREKCVAQEIRLIEVPYTWDNSRNELVSIINRTYPDLLLK